MAHIHTGQLTKPGEYWKHMGWKKKVFWHGERKAAQALIDDEITGKESLTQAKKKKAKQKKPFKIEYRYRSALKGDSWSKWYSHGSYTTEKRRERALEQMQRRGTSYLQYEYRAKEE